MIYKRLKLIESSGRYFGFSKVTLFHMKRALTSMLLIMVASCATNRCRDLYAIPISEGRFSKISGVCDCGRIFVRIYYKGEGYIIQQAHAGEKGWEENDLIAWKEALGPLAVKVLSDDDAKVLMRRVSNSDLEMKEEMVHAIKYYTLLGISLEFSNEHDDCPSNLSEYDDYDFEI